MCAGKTGALPRAGLSDAGLAAALGVEHGAGFAVGMLWAPAEGRCGARLVGSGEPESREMWVLRFGSDTEK